MAGRRRIHPVDQPDARTGHHVLYAHIKELPGECGLLVGDAAHNLRCVLDHLTFAAMLAVHAGSPPPDLIEKSEFPIVGGVNREGAPRANPDADFDSIVAEKLAAIPNGLREALRKLQPYKRGAQWATHPLWVIHDLDRVDKHRHLHLVTAAANLSHLSMGGTGYFPYFWFGGGVVEDGDCEWADPAGPAPHLQADIARQVVIGQPEAGSGREIVPLVRSLRGFLDTDVLPAIEPFL
jgi:hypothetical protein